MSEQVYRHPKNIIFEMYQPTESGNVDPKRPPRGGSSLMPARFFKPRNPRRSDAADKPAKA